MFDLLPGQLDHPVNFGGDAQVLEEPLVGRPELAPHGLLHALLCVDQIGSLLELLAGAHPLRAAKQSHLVPRTGDVNRTVRSQN